MEITLQHLQQLCPGTGIATLKRYLLPLNQTLKHYKIDTKQRAAMFLAQIAHESGNFRAIQENLNYSAQALMRTWPSRFPTLAIANQFARQPEKIANKVYANRMGNGPPSSGDGWRYIGRGLIQLTGKNNYTKFANAIGMTLPQTVEYLKTPEGAVASAGWFWDVNKLNVWADKNDLIGVTRRINGGTIGLDDRAKKYQLLMKIL